MKHHRRHFIKQASAAMLAGFSLNDFATAAPMPPANDSDDVYWTKLREQFPLNKNIIYLNNGSLGPSPMAVINEIHKWMTLADEELNYVGWTDAIKKIATFVGADENEIAVTGNTTQGINIACWGVPMRKGDEVILTTHEHAGGALPWLNRQKLHGIVIKTFDPGATAAETLDRIASLITKKTRVIAVPHILCSQGQTLPVKEISRLGKEKGIFVLIDGAHGPGMMPIDLHDIGCDAYAACFHKWMLGPKGSGFLYVRKDFQDTLTPYFVGAGSDDAKWDMSLAAPRITQYHNSAHRYYYGTLNGALYKGAEASIDFINTIGAERVYARINELGKYTQDLLLGMDDKVEVLNPSETISRSGMNGFRVKGVSFEKFHTMALDRNIRIRIMPENSLNCLRVSTHIYNSKSDIDKLIELIGTT
jgi:cysteine desulfurase/selenocysteine lyase